MKSTSGLKCVALTRGDADFSDLCGGIDLYWKTSSSHRGPDLINRFYAGHIH